MTVSTVPVSRSRIASSSAARTFAALESSQQLKYISVSSPRNRIFSSGRRKETLSGEWPPVFKTQTWSLIIQPGHDSDLGSESWPGWMISDQVWVLKTGGHSPDSVSFLLPEEKILFLGDETLLYFNCWLDSSAANVLSLIHIL